jgi:hypothetical protein
LYINIEKKAPQYPAVPLKNPTSRRGLNPQISIDLHNPSLNFYPGKIGEILCPKRQAMPLPCRDNIIDCDLSAINVKKDAHKRVYGNRR